MCSPLCFHGTGLHSLGCPAGQYLDSSTCVECAMDTYQPDAGSTECFDCPSDFETESTGSTSCVASPSDDDANIWFGVDMDNGTNASIAYTGIFVVSTLLCGIVSLCCRVCTRKTALDLKGDYGKMATDDEDITFRAEVSALPFYTLTRQRLSLPFFDRLCPDIALLDRYAFF